MEDLSVIEFIVNFLILKILNEANQLKKNYFWLLEIQECFHYHYWNDNFIQFLND